MLPSRLAVSAAEAAAAAADLGLPVVVKAQVKTGGRGKAGGIRVCRSADEVAAAAADILAMTIRDKRVEALLVEQAVDIARELYLAISSSRAERGPVLIFCREGGVDIEARGASRPDGAGARRRRPAARPLRLPGARRRGRGAHRGGRAGPGRHARRQALAAVVRGVWRLYHERDATLVEVNPLVLTTRGEVVCLDSKVTIDDNALYRQADITARASRRTNARRRPAGRASRSSAWTATSACWATAPAS